MSEFDWVKARSDCTVSAVFKKLAEDVKGDIARFANLHPGPAQSHEFGDCGKDRFFVESKLLSSLSKAIGLCSSGRMRRSISSAGRIRALTRRLWF